MFLLTIAFRRRKKTPCKLKNDFQNVIWNLLRRKEPLVDGLENGNVAVQSTDDFAHSKA